MPFYSGHIGYTFRHLREDLTCLGRSVTVWKIVTDKLRSYLVAHRAVFPEAIHVTGRYENNRAEQSQGLPRFMGMKRRGCKNGGCGASNRPGRLRGSLLLTQPCQIYLTWGDTWCQLTTTGISG